MPVARTRLRFGGRMPALPLAVMLAALMLVGLAAVPAPVGAATQAMVPACSGVNLRASATTGAALRARLATSAKITVAATVPGSSWRTDCAGLKAGSTWHRISHINGATVRSLYGCHVPLCRRRPPEGGPERRPGPRRRRRPPCPPPPAAVPATHRPRGRSERPIRRRADAPGEPRPGRARPPRVPGGPRPRGHRPGCLRSRARPTPS